MKRVLVYTVCAWFVCVGSAFGAGWSAPTTQTVYTMSAAPLGSSYTADNVSVSGSGGSLDYPLKFKDGSYVKVPASATHWQGFSATMASNTRFKAFTSDGYCYIASIPLVVPSTVGEKRLYVIKARSDWSRVSGANNVIPAGTTFKFRQNNVERGPIHGGALPWYRYGWANGVNGTANSASTPLPTGQSTMDYGLLS